MLFCLRSTFHHLKSPVSFLTALKHAYRRQPRWGTVCDAWPRRAVWQTLPEWTVARETWFSEGGICLCDVLISLGACPGISLLKIHFVGFFSNVETLYIICVVSWCFKVEFSNSAIHSCSLFLICQLPFPPKPPAFKLTVQERWMPHSVRKPGPRLWPVKWEALGQARHDSRLKPLLITLCAWTEHLCTGGWFNVRFRSAEGFFLPLPSTAVQ